MARQQRPIAPASVPLRKLVPNMLTAGALCAGIASLHYSMHGQFEKAIGAIALSFVLDGLDGRMARLLRVTSRFGEKFDSISDFTAFGFAPAFLLYQWQLKEQAGVVGLVAVIMHALCAAIRLARFTVQAKKQKLGTPVSKFFQGLPAPAAGGAVLIPPMLSLSDTINYKLPVWGTVAWTVFIALLMVSKLPMISIKGLRISRNLVVPLMILMGLITLGLVLDGWLTFSSLCFLYLLSFPAGLVLHKRLKETQRLQGVAPAAEQPGDGPALGAAR